MKRTIIALFIAACFLVGCTSVDQAASSDVAAVNLQPINDAAFSSSNINVVKQKRIEEEQHKKAEEEKKRIEEEQQRAAEEAEQAEESEEEYIAPIYEELTPYEQYEATVAQRIADENSDLKSAGVLYDEDGVRYTWYSQNVLPGGGLTELNSSGRTVDANGYVVDGEGFIAVASGEHAIGTTLETPFGNAKVYDYCETPGTIDVYTAW